MKKRDTLVIILGLALVTAYYVLGNGLYERLQENRALGNRIEAIEFDLAQLPEPADGLEGRLAAAAAELEETRNILPPAMSSTRIVADVLSTADRVGIEAVPLLTEPWTDDSINDCDYAVFRLNLAAAGTFSALVDFVGELEDSGIATLLLENLEFSTVAGLSDDGNNNGNIPVNAGLSLVIYTRSLTR